MDTEIRYRKSSAQSFGSTAAFLTADDVNELCRSWIEAERERTHALLTELLIQICDNTIPEVVSRLPELRGPAGPVGPAGKLPIVKEWGARRFSTKAPSSPTMAAAIKRFATQASRLTTKRIGDVSRLLVAMPSRSATAARSKKNVEYTALRRSRPQRGVVSGPARQARSLSGPWMATTLCAGQARRRRRTGPQGDRGPVALPGRRERTPRKLWAGRWTAVPTPLRRS